MYQNVADIYLMCKFLLFYDEGYNNTFGVALAECIEATRSRRTAVYIITVFLIGGWASTDQLTKVFQH